MNVLRIAWSTVVLAVGAVHLATGWAGGLAGVVFVAAIVLTYSIVFAARALRISAGITVITVTSLAVLGGHFVSGAADPLSAMTDAVPRLLTAPRPAPVTPDMLMPGAVSVIVVTLTVAVSVARGGRALLAPPVGAAVLYTATALLTAGQADRHGLTAATLVLLTALGWLVADRPPKRSGRRIHLVPPAALLAVLAVLGLTASVLPVADAFEPRTLVEPPVAELAVPSPLPQLASWAGAGDTELFRVRGGDVPLRLVALSDYTGATWRAASLYGPIGAVAPPDLPDGRKQVTAGMEVTISGLSGPWLPTAGRPTATDADGAVVDPDSGSLVLPTGARPGLRYTVKSTVDAPSDADLLNAAVPTRSSRRYLALPNLPFTLAEYARRTVASARTPFEQAVAIEEVVRTGRRPDAGAPVGSSYARLETFLFGADGTPGAGTGTAEQFASAFAVLARAVGLPSRVVVGFRPVPPGPDGVAVVRAGAATAWPEVYFTGWGWVPFDPVAGEQAGPGSIAKREVLNRLATPAPPPATTAAAAPPAPPRSPGARAAAASADTGNPWYPVLLVALVVVAAVGLLGALRVSRRVRLRRAGATGAWAHVLDLLLLAGRRPARHQSAPRIAAGIATITPAAQQLATLADWAAFSPATTPPAADDHAWTLARQVHIALRHTVPWHRRIFWPIDPRPLVRGRG